MVRLTLVLGIVHGVRPEGDEFDEIPREVRDSRELKGGDQAEDSKDREHDANGTPAAPPQRGRARESTAPSASPAPASTLTLSCET